MPGRAATALARALAVPTLVAAALAGCGADDGIRVSGPELREGAELPERVACTGESAPPVVRWTGGPDDVAGWAVVVEDPDGPRGTATQWLVTGLGPAVREVGAELPAGAVASLTSTGQPGWAGPCPPMGDTHRYRFRVHALRAPLVLPEATPPLDARRRVEAATLAVGELQASFTGR